MAFADNSQLTSMNDLRSKVAGPENKVWWYEAGADAAAAVEAANYFDAAGDLLQVGDRIVCICSDGFCILKVATVINVAGQAHTTTAHLAYV
jgi:hypothetical protein